jgi:hypothetical protein
MSLTRSFKRLAQRTIAQPVLELATPMVVGSDAREPRPRALPPVSRRQRTGR